jgi:hypothetical protein
MINLGATVIYRSRTGDYSLAAIVTATASSIKPLGVERGFVPPLSGEHCVHLAVMTPGLPSWETPGHTAQVLDPTREFGDRVLWVAERPGENDLKGEEFVAQTPFGGTYQEFDIPMWLDPRMQPGNRITFGQDGFEYDQQAPGTWTFA